VSPTPPLGSVSNQKEEIRRKGPHTKAGKSLTNYSSSYDEERNLGGMKRDGNAIMKKEAWL